MRFSLYKSNLYYDDPPVPEPEPIPVPAPAPAPAGDRKFSQADVDRMMRLDKDKAKRERDESLQHLQALKEQGVTPENLDTLNQTIERLQNEGKTKEQLAQESQGKLEKKYKSEIEKVTGEGTAWKGRYEKYRAKSEILASASELDAHNPEQIYNILLPNTKIVEELGSDGKPTGEFVPRVTLRDKDKDGKDLILELSVSDAIKRMTEQEIHKNLFKSGASNGVGGRNNGRSSGTGATTIPTDTAAFMAARKKDPNLLRKQETKS